MNALKDVKKPWKLTFSHDSLQKDVLTAWKGSDENKEAAQKLLIEGTKRNGQAQKGEYKADDGFAGKYVF